MMRIRTKPRTSGGARRQRFDHGYVLLTLLLFVAVLAVAAAAVAPHIAFEIKRDREEELVHRGAEYTRAIQRFAKANARYPLRLDELQSSGGVKYIRKLYKDPITGGDFRLLTMSDIRVATGTTVQGDPGFPKNQQGSGIPAVAPVSASALPADSNANSNSADSGSATAAPTAEVPAPVSVPPRSNLSGGAIVGVASKSTALSIREFDKKNHYNDWLFFYDPSYSRGQRINGPTSLTLPSPASLNAGGSQNSPPAAPEVVSSSGQK
jgi:type II secretory pathway pseudopilin PulG